MKIRKSCSLSEIKRALLTNTWQMMKSVVINPARATLLVDDDLLVSFGGKFRGETRVEIMRKGTLVCVSCVHY